MQETPNNAEELKRCLEAAFADAVYPGDDHLTISGCPCAECRETREFFKVYLISGLGEGIADWTEQNKAEGARQAALWSLSPLGNNTESLRTLFAERTSGFSFAQQKCIAAYAQAISELEPEEENYAAAASFWKDRTTRTSNH